MIQDQQSYRIQIIKPWFRFYLKGSRLQLKLRGPTIHIFKCYQPKQIPKLPEILVNYFPYEQHNEIVTFDSIIEGSDLTHQPLKNILSSFFQRLTICHAPWLKEKHHIATIQKKIKQLSSEVRVYVRNSNRNSLENNVFIYFADNEGIKSRVIDYLEFSERFQNMSVVYSLNSFIDRKIENECREFFVYNFLEIYRHQIKNIPKKNYQVYKYLQVKNIEPIYIPRKQVAYSPENWAKQQSKGIYGLKIQLIGFQYEIIKFYSSLQLFFRKIKYCVKESGCDFTSQTYILRKYQNKMLKCFYLNKRQYVILGPPELFQTAFEEIQKHQWTVTKQNYPNMGFQIIKRKEKKFRKQLVEQKIVCEQLVINQEDISFLSDRKNYEKIQYFTRWFICAHLEVQIKLDFIKERHHFQCFKQYLLVNDPFYENIELKWFEGHAYVICNDQKTKDTYNQIKQNYEQCVQSMTCILSTRNVDHPLVKVTQVANDYLTQDFIQRKLFFQGLQLQIHFKNLLTSEEEYAVLMVPNLKNKDQLQFILQKNCDMLKNEKLQFIEIFRPTSKEIKSIVIWNYNSHSHKKGHSNEELHQLNLDSLLQIVNNRQKLVFLVTKQLFQQDFQSLIFILEHIPHYQYQICRKVDIVLSNSLKSSHRRMVYSEIRSYLRKWFCQEPIQQFLIKQSYMPYISQFKLNQMFFKIDKNSDKLPCSNLNSFIFCRQIQAIERNQRSQNRSCGLFLPKSLIFVEILVDLHKMKAYIVQNNSVRHFDISKMYLLLDMINLLRQMLPFQCFIVLYARKGEENVLSALYLYSPQTRNLVKKYKLKKNNSGKLEFISSEIIHKIYWKKCEQQTFFQLETHRNYVEELKKQTK